MRVPSFLRMRNFSASRKTAGDPEPLTPCNRHKAAYLALARALPNQSAPEPVVNALEEDFASGLLGLGIQRCPVHAGQRSMFDSNGNAAIVSAIGHGASRLTGKAHEAIVKAIVQAKNKYNNCLLTWESSSP